MQKVPDRTMTGELQRVKCDGAILFLSPPDANPSHGWHPTKQLKCNDVVLLLSSEWVGVTGKRFEYFVLSRVGIGWIKKQDIVEMS